MTSFEKIAARNIKAAVNFILGEYYNCLQDDMTDCLPDSRGALEQEIYDAAMVDLFEPGYMAIGRAPKEMRFAGEAFCREYVHKALEKDEDFKEMAACLGW